MSVARLAPTDEGKTIIGEKVVLPRNVDFWDDLAAGIADRCGGHAPTLRRIAACLLADLCGWRRVEIAHALSVHPGHCSRLIADGRTALRSLLSPQTNQCP